jgi:hypothetical protein
MKSRRLAAGALVCGLAVVVIAQRLAPIAGPPLYDGVPVTDPYKWLSPPSGLQGGAQSAHQTDVVADIQAGLAVGTPELPPQVQVVVDPGALALADATTSVTISIEPVGAPAVQPSDGTVAGNVYRIATVDQAGTAIGFNAGGTATLVLRGPPVLRSATIESFDGGVWTKLHTDPAGIPDIFTATVTGFGDFALVAPAGWKPAGEKAGPPAATANPTATPSSAPATPGASAVSSGPGGASGPTSTAPPATAAASAGQSAGTAALGSSGDQGTHVPSILQVALVALVVVAVVVVLRRPMRTPRE